VIRARWWSCGEGTLLRHEEGVSVNQVRRRQCKRNLLGGSGPDRSGVTTAHDLHRTMGNINVCTESELLKVKVPIFFSPRWVSRHAGRDVMQVIR
jgi:hypothetical protein